MNSDLVCDKVSGGVHVFNPNGICVHCEISKVRVDSHDEKPYWLCCGSLIYGEHHKVHCYPDRRRWGTQSQHAAEQRGESKPVHRIGVSFIAAVPDGAKLMAFNDQIFLVAPSMPPCFVTPTGLVPMQHADGSDLK